MLSVDPDLRLSAQRALLGAVADGVRLVAVWRDENTVNVRSVLASKHDAVAIEELSVAMTEIMADFPDCNLSEAVDISDAPIRATEDNHVMGWVYRRYERLN